MSAVSFPKLEELHTYRSTNRHKYVQAEGNFRAGIISWEIFVFKEGGGRWRNFPLPKFRGVRRAVKMRLALNSVGPDFWGMCLGQQILSDFVN